MSGSAAAIAPAPAPPNLDDIYEAAGREWNVDSNLLRSVAGVESGGNVNTPNSKAGAQGLMQFMPGTAKAVGVEDPHDPVQAIFGAAKLLNENLNRYQGDVPTALRAYNAGTDPDRWNNPETQAYPGKVAAIYGTLTGSQSGNAPGPKPYQVASADTGTMSDVAPPPDAPPRAGPAAGMDLSPHPDAPPADGIPTQEITTTAPAPVAVADASPAAGMDLAPHPQRASGVAALGAPVDVTALPPADFFKLTTGGQAPAAANSNTPAPPPDVTSMSPTDFFKATTAPAGSGIAPDGSQGKPGFFANVGNEFMGELNHQASRAYSGANWVDQHVPALGALDKAAGLNPGVAATATKANADAANRLSGGTWGGMVGSVGADTLLTAPLGGVVSGAVKAGGTALADAIPYAGRAIQTGTNILSGSGGTNMLTKGVGSVASNALQGGLAAGALGDNPLYGAAAGSVVGPIGGAVLRGAGKVISSAAKGTPGALDRTMTAFGAPPRPDLPAAPAPEPPPTITQKWNGAPARPDFPSAPAEPAPPPGSAAADRQALIEQAQKYSNGLNLTQSAAPREPMAGPSGAPNKLNAAPAPADAAPPAEYTTTAPAPSAPPVDAGGGRFAPSYDANRLQADVPLERADPAIPPQGMAPPRPVPPEIQAQTDALLNPAPQSMGAASSSRDTANPPPQMSSREAAASRATGENWRLMQPVPSTRDTTIYVPGSKPTEADVAADPEVSLTQKSIRQQNDADFTTRDQQNNNARVDHLDNLAGTPTNVEVLKQARQEQATQDLDTSFSKKAPADAQPIVDQGQAILSGRLGKLPPVKDAIEKALAPLYDADGNLETDPELLYGARQNIGYLMSKTAQQEKPGLREATSELAELKDALDGVIEKAAPGYKQYLANYAAASKPIDTMELLQQYKPGLLDMNGNMTPNKFQSMMKSIVQARQASGSNPAKSIDDDTMEALWNLRDDLRRQNNRDLGKARGSDTSQLLHYGGKLGLTAVHGVAAHTMPIVGNALVHYGADALRKGRLAKRTANLLNPDLSGP